MVRVVEPVATVSKTFGYEP